MSTEEHKHGYFENGRLKVLLRVAYDVIVFGSLIGIAFYAGAVNERVNNLAARGNAISPESDRRLSVVETILAHQSHDIDRNEKQIEALWTNLDAIRNKQERYGRGDGK